MKNTKIRAADYIIDFLVQHGIKDVFLVTGGGAMHLNDAFGRNTDIKYLACHHEQACAMAAESYARMSGRMAAVNVTTGPGGTNAITGVYGAYVDSIPMFVVSGQVKWETLVASTNLPMRQLGDQEINIVDIVKPVTKYAVMVTKAEDLRYHLEKAFFMATHGRPGPVWIDVPMNIQGAQIDPSKLVGFDPTKEFPDQNVNEMLKTNDLQEKCEILLEKLKTAKRPVVMCGAGVRISGAYTAFLDFIDKLGVPVVTNWNAHDLLPNDHPLFCGRPGTIGDRPGNFMVQNADLILVLGSRLNIRQVSYNWESFARHAYKVMVDIDINEIKKPTLKIDLPIHADLKDFFFSARKLLNQVNMPARAEWIAWGKERQKKYDVVLPEYWNSESVNPYCFVRELFNRLSENELIVTGDGTACVVTFQAAIIKKNQRLYTNSGCASMGYDLPAAIGAYRAMTPTRLVCIAGDGSIQMNIQELQTIAHNKMNIKLFVLNNRGYHSIRQTQQSYFPDNIVGCGVESGLSFPDITALGNIYGFGTRRVENHFELKTGIEATLNSDGPQLCEIVLDLKQQFAPKLTSKKLSDGRMVSSPLEDMSPFLSREELQQNMIVPLIEET